MKILHVASSISLERGGPPAVIIGLTKNLAKKNIDVTIVAPNQREASTNILKKAGVEVKLFDVSVLSKIWLSHSFEINKFFSQNISDFDLIHIHGAWSYVSYIAYRYAKIFSKPYIVTLHGTLSPWCLNHKALKKKIYAIIIQKRMLKEANGIQTFSGNEAVQLRNYNINSNTTIIPNGLDIENFGHLTPNNFFDDIYPELKSKKVILFLGRLHPVKGLDLLCKSFGKIAKNRDDVRLVIAGPDIKGYKKELGYILKSVNAYDKVIFPGMLKEANKYAALNRADIFVLPSYSEGFSIAILEAMMSGLPVIVTHRCSLNEVAETKSGIIIEPEVGQLTEALLKLLNSPNLCKEMGKNGRMLVEDYYSWDGITDKMIEFYKKVIRSYK